MNEWKHRLGGVLVVALVVATSGCGVEPGEPPTGEVVQHPAQALEVRTSVALDHVNPLHSPVHIERFGMPNARVMFLQVDGDERTVAVSAAVALTFDVAAGVLTVDGPRVELPGPGEWDVRLHLYPSEADGLDARTVVIEGTWDPTRDHGEPSPLPWREHDAKSHDTEPLQHFTWSSSAAAIVDLDTFALDADATDLVVAVPLDTWVSTVLVPILRERLGGPEVAGGEDTGAHPHGSAVGRGDDARGVVFEDDGVGLSNLLERVSAGYRHGPQAR